MAISLSPETGEALFSVLGHECPALRNAQRLAATSQCIPGIADDGTLLGCDDDNPYCLMFCPYCGAAFDNTTRQNGGYVLDEDGILRRRY